MSVIAFTGAKGGVGVSTIAVNLANLLAERHETRLLAMGDAFDWSLHLRGAFARADMNLPSTWRPSGSVDGDVWEGAPGYKSFKCLALGELSEDASEYAAVEKKAIQPFEKSDMLVLDAPFSKLRRIMSLSQTGVHIRVLRADAACLTSVLKHRDEFDASVSTFAGWRHFYVLNLVDPRRQLCRDLEAIAVEALGSSLLTSFRFDASTPDAAADGQLVVDHAPHCLAAEELRAFANQTETLFPGAALAQPMSA